MKRLTINMVLADRYRFDFVNAVEIESSWEMLTDQCSILLPTNLKLDGSKLRSMLKPGDHVTIDVGYDDENTRIFEGYLTGIKPKTPVELHCEDAMYALKGTPVTDTMKQASLSNILAKHFSGIPVEFEETTIGTIQFDRLSQAKILEKLRESHGLYSFFRRGKLVIGKIYSGQGANEHTFRFHWDIIGENLEYQRKEDMKLKVTAVSNNPDGTVTEVKLGDSEGEERTLNFYNLSKDALKKQAARELDRLKYDGYHGDFTTFGRQVVFHGDVVNLEHPEESDKTGRYYVDKVITNFGVDGFRQQITLGPKA
jgi:hypothetical protein